MKATVRLATPLVAMVVLLTACAGAGAGTAASAGPDLGSGSVAAGPALPPCPQPSEPVGSPAGASGGDHLPSLRLPCLGGGAPVDLAAVAAGTPTVVNLWASWCPPCRQEMPALEAFAERYSGRVQVFGVLTKDPGGDWQETVRTTGVNYPSGRDDEGRLLVWSRSPGLPATLLVRGDGTVAYRKFGQIANDRELAALVAQHLGVGG